MANTTSGTTTFDKNFSIDEIIEEAYDRLGIFTLNGGHMKTARRSLNIMFQEWGNRGLHYWEVGNSSFTLVDGQAVYTTYRSTADGTSDTYQGLSNKTSEGTPSQYFVQRFIDKVTVTLYLTPGSTEAGNFINFYFVKRIQDVGVYTNASDIPYRFVPCMSSGLSFYLSQKYQPQRTQELKLYYEDELQRALVEDGSSSSSFITPKNYYPNV
jgi:hypothetical protein